MKARNISLLALFAAFCIIKTEAAGNPFAPENHPLSNGVAPASIPTPPPSLPAEPVNPFGPEPERLENHAPIAEKENPFAPHMAEPEHLENHSLMAEKENPFAPHTTEPEHLENHSLMAEKENPFAAHMAEPEHHEGAKPSKPLHQGHVSTMQKTSSIKTVNITPGHSATLEPIAIMHGIEAERYFIQDKKYESYLSSHVTPTERTYNVTIPAAVHVGSFTVFKVQGMHGTPDHLEPAYHVEIQGNAHVLGEGTQYSEPQGSAVEKLTQLEDKYLTGIQTQFKAFTQEVRELISTAHQNGESLEAAKLHVTQKVTTKGLLKLTVGDSHTVTSFSGGSSQSSNPAIVSAELHFEGTKIAPEWKLILTAHKPGEAIITYSTGSESYLQPVTVIESSTPHSSKHEHKVIEKKEATDLNHTHKKEHHVRRTHTEEEEEESKEKKSEEINEKTADELADEDKPFARFLKESPSINDKESSASVMESEQPRSTRISSNENESPVLTDTEDDDYDDEEDDDEEDDDK